MRSAYNNFGFGRSVTPPPEAGSDAGSNPSVHSGYGGSYHGGMGVYRGSYHAGMGGYGGGGGSYASSSYHADMGRAYKLPATMDVSVKSSPNGGLWATIKDEAYNPTIEWMKLEFTKTVTVVKPVSLYKTWKSKDSLRVVCVSDTHGQVKDIKVPDGDILIHAGDFTNTGEKKYVEELSNWLGTLPHKHKIVIAGNHEATFQSGYYEKNWKRFHDTMESVPHCRESLKNCIYLEDSEAIVEGYKFYGSPWTPSFCNWAYNVDRGRDSREVWEKIPKDTDILVTHGPPLGYGDQVPSESTRVGCLDLLKVVETVKPLYHIFGHVHEGYGVYSNGKTTFINASTCTVNYKPTNDPIVFDLPRRA